MQRVIDPSTIIGWGVDADPRNEPTYPMRERTSDDRDDRDWVRPTQQAVTVEVLRSSERPNLPAVFGTSVPPKGLSGMLRRRAFSDSEGKWAHWLTLLLADRVNVVEGLLQDIARGKIPNIPAEMGIRAELRHNRAGLVRKAAITVAILLAARALLNGRTPPRSRELRPSE